MKRMLCLLAVLLAFPLILTDAARADVKDGGGFFSAGAIDSANQTLSDIKSKYHKDVIIETFPAIPADQQGNYDSNDKAGFFDRWAKKQFADEKINGIYLLICRDPSFVKAEVGRDTAKGFTLADSREMVGKVLAQFKQKQFDAGLADGVSFVQSTLASSEGGAAAGNTSNGTPSYGPANPGGNYSNNSTIPQGNGPIGGGTSHFSFLGWIIVVGVLFVVIRIVRGLMSGFRSMGSGMGGNMGGGMIGGMGGPPVGGGYGYGGGYGNSGGGFGRGLLGGLLGGVAGNWLMNREREGGIFGGGGGNIGGGNIGGGGPIDTGGAGGGSFGDTSGFSGNDAGQTMGGDAGGGGFGDSGGGGGDAGGGSF